MAANYLNAMFPQVDINQLGPVAGMMLGDQFNLAKQNNAMNQGLMQQQMNFDAQSQPLELEHKRAQTEYQKQLARQSGAAADKSVWDLEQDKRLAEPKYQSDLAKFMQGIKESEVKQMHAQIEKDLMSPDPKVRQQATTLYKATGDMLKMYEQEKLRADSAARVAQIGADSRQAVAAAKGGVNDFFSNLLKQTKGDPTKMRSGLIAEATRIQASDPEQAAQYLAQAQALEGQQNAALAGAQPAYVIGPDNKPMLNPNAQRPLASTPGTPSQAPTQSAPTQYQAGQVYTGKTGKYKYKGGDPNNKANWEKVE